MNSGSRTKEEAGPKELELSEYEHEKNNKDVNGKRYLLLPPGLNSSQRPLLTPLLPDLRTHEEASTRAVSLSPPHLSSLVWDIGSKIFLEQQLMQ